MSMKTLRVGFYKNSKTFFGKLIRWKQSKKYDDNYYIYSHVELVFDDGVSFSSSEVDGGVRFKAIDFEPDKWDFTELVVSDKEYDRVLEFCKSQINHKYNWLGIFYAQILNFNRKGEGDWFCSEICARAIQEAHYLCKESALFISPAKMRYLLLNGDGVKEL